MCKALPEEGEAHNPSRTCSCPLSRVNCSVTAIAHLLQADGCVGNGPSKRGQEVPSRICAEEVPEGGLSCLPHFSVCDRLRCSIVQDRLRTGSCTSMGLYCPAAVRSQEMTERPAWERARTT